MLGFIVELLIASYIIVAYCYHDTYLIEKRLKKFNENNNLRGKK